MTENAAENATPSTESEEKISGQETEATEVESAAEESKKEQSTPESEDDNGFSIVIEDDQDSPAIDKEGQEAPEWVKNLRKHHADITKENRELKQRLESLSANDEDEELGEEPTIDDCDYDQDLFKRRIIEYNEKARQIEIKKQASRQKQQQAEQAWQDRMTAYEQAGTSLAKDFKQAESDARTFLDAHQMGLIIAGADKPEALIYAIGKNPAKAQELANIKDPAKFAFAVSKLETKVKVNKRKAAPPPEKSTEATASNVQTAEARLEKLRADARESGDWTTFFSEQRRIKKSQS